MATTAADHNSEYGDNRRGHAHSGQAQAGQTPQQLQAAATHSVGLPSVTEDDAAACSAQSDAGDYCFPKCRGFP